MNTQYDAIVVGLGVHGAAALRALAKRGLRVLGLDRFDVPHNMGSSHGESRIIRQAYHEHPAYVPFVQQAYRLWDQVAADARREILVKTGGLLIGKRSSRVVSGALESARQHKLPHEVLTPGEAAKRYPMFALAPDEVAVVEPRAGALRLPESHLALIDSAKTAGATVRTRETVQGWRATKDGVRVTTETGDYAARELVLAAGAWLGSLVPELERSLRVERQVVGWFRARQNGSMFASDRFPIFIWDRTPEHETIYGFPDLGTGVKVGIHHAGETVDARTVSREVSVRDAARLRREIAAAFPDLDVEPSAASTCLYTNTPDETFILDRHPDHANVIIASCCSGHGYKFAPAVGEAVADLVQGQARPDLGLFRISRFWPKSW